MDATTRGHGVHLLTLGVVAAGVGAGLLGFHLTASPPSSAVITSAASPDNCPRYFIYNLRGSGENKTDYEGLGSTGKTFADAVKFAVKPDSVEVLPSSYPAEINPLVYSASVNEGEQLLVADLDKFRARCDASRSHIIVEGYSQGAQVVHGNPHLGTSKDVQEALDRNGVSDIVLFGDPMFCPRKYGATNAGMDGSYTFSGDYDPKAKGIELCALPLKETPGRAIWSYCHEKDRVCQGGGKPDNNLISIWKDGNHQSYPDLDADGAGWRVAMKYRHPGDPANFNAPAAYLVCQSGTATVQAFGRDADSISLMAETTNSAGNAAKTKILDIAGPQDGTSHTVSIPPGVETISAYSNYRDPVPYRRLATFSVEKQGCSPLRAPKKQKAATPKPVAPPQRANPPSEGTTPKQFVAPKPVAPARHVDPPQHMPPAARHDPTTQEMPPPADTDPAWQRGSTRPDPNCC
jgi:hypothetical protein